MIANIFSFIKRRIQDNDSNNFQTFQGFFGMLPVYFSNFSTKTHNWQMFKFQSPSICPLPINHILCCIIFTHNNLCFYTILDKLFITFSIVHNFAIFIFIKKLSPQSFLTTYLCNHFRHFHYLRTFRKSSCIICHFHGIRHLFRCFFLIPQRFIFLFFLLSG